MASSMQQAGLVGLSAVGLASAVWLFVHRRATMYKMRLFFSSFLFLFRSNDVKWKNKTRDLELSDPVHEEKVKTLIFLRHGESTWNVTFNRSKNPIFFIPRLVFAASYEFYLLLTGVRDSWFYDSPLCHEGIEQSETLARTLASLPAHNPNDPINHLLHTVNATDNTGIPASRIVSSNLRRSLSTAVIGLFDRLSRTEESIMVHDSLQEISRNPDTLSITPAFLKPEPSWIEKRYPLDIPKVYERQMDVERNQGSKALHRTGRDRIDSFNEWIFNDIKEDFIVVSGHSLWFRHYFREFLPHSIDHPGKTMKISNSGLVSLQVRCYISTSGQKTYVIDPESVKPIYLDFTK